MGFVSTFRSFDKLRTPQAQGATDSTNLGRGKLKNEKGGTHVGAPRLFLVAISMKRQAYRLAEGTTIFSAMVSMSRFISSTLAAKPPTMIWCTPRSRNCFTSSMSIGLPMPVDTE